MSSPIIMNRPPNVGNQTFRFWFDSAISIAKKINCHVDFYFNSVKITVDKNSNYSEILKLYHISLDHEKEK